MSILRRMRDISVATLNELLEQSEDPIRLIDRYLYEQREQLQESEKLYRQCLTHAQSLRQQYLNAEEMRQKREQQALLALKAGEDDMARLALHEKLHFEEKSENYKKLYEQSRESIMELEAQLQQIKSDYQEVADKRSFYLARLESIRLQQRMNERMSSLGGGQVGDRAFIRLEDRVSDMELEVKSLRDVRRQIQDPIVRAGETVRQAVEQELGALRKKLEQGDWKQ